MTAISLPGRMLADTNRYWNVGGTGGDGNWSSSPGDKNWNVTAGAVSGNTSWPDTNDDAAVFQDSSGGTVTVIGDVMASRITQIEKGYTINAGSITLVRDSLLTTPSVGVVSGTLKIDSVLAGIDGMNKLGQGTLVLSGSNSYTGTTNVQDGVLSLTGELASSTIRIGNLAEFKDFSGGLSSSTELENGGVLTILADETVSTYTQQGLGILNGSATLTATGGATLNGGDIDGTLLGDTTINGDVVVHGALGGGSLVVDSGILIVGGTAANGTVSISAAGALMDSAGGLASDAVVTNAGELEVLAEDSISTYLQTGNGRLSGPGALIVTSGAQLGGGSVSGTLLGDITTTNDVEVSGTLGGGTLSVTGGTLKLSGISTNGVVNIGAAGTLHDHDSGLDAAAIVTNAGTLTLDDADTVDSYIQNGGTLMGTGLLSVTGGATLNGGTVSGTLLGDVTSTGDVDVSGTLGGGALSVMGGTLTLKGTATGGLVNIAAPATLLDVNGGLTAETIVNNSGLFVVDAAERISRYVSNAGTLDGAGKLTVTEATLNDHSFIEGRLEAGRLVTHGEVYNYHTAEAGQIRIEDGMLLNFGTLGNDLTRLEIASGAVLLAGGEVRYRLLTTSGNGVGEWIGDLDNSSVIAPGGIGSFGTLRVEGDFTNTPGGTLRVDVSSSGKDLLLVDGKAVFGGTLSLNQSGPDQIAPFVAVQLVSASSYEGNFSSLEENLDGIVFFNPENGSITRAGTGAGSGELFSGTTRNQRSTWISLYDDVIDPGKTNVTADPGAPSGYDITSGMADDGNPDLMRALAASFTPAGLDVALLNHLSAEVYTSVLDYGVRASRHHQRTALSAPGLAPRKGGDAKSGPAADAKSSAKDGGAPAFSLGQDWEFFAAADHFNAKTDSSHNQANYEISGAGLVAGARNQLTDHFQLTGYLAADDGSIKGSLIDSDQFGWSLGLFGRTLLHEKTGTHLITGISYGRYDSDGTRQSAAATTSGWTPGKVDFSSIDSSALELLAGVETTVYANEGFRVIPNAGLRYTAATMDGFTESTGAGAGSPIALKVAGENRDEWTFEMGVTAEADLTEKLALLGQAGFNAGLGGGREDIRSRFVKGSRTMSAESGGLTDDLFYLGLGLEYRVNEDVTVGMGCRSDFRPSEPVETGYDISTSFRF